MLLKKWYCDEHFKKVYRTLKSIPWDQMARR